MAVRLQELSADQAGKFINQIFSLIGVTHKTYLAGKDGTTK